jgi:hypothetical protein
MRDKCGPESETVLRRQAAGRNVHRVIREQGIRAIPDLGKGEAGTTLLERLTFAAIIGS